MFSWPANLFQAISPASNPTLVTQAGQGGEALHFVHRLPGFQPLGLAYFTKSSYLNLNVLYGGNSKPLLYPLNLI